MRVHARQIAALVLFAAMAACCGEGALHAQERGENLKRKLDAIDKAIILNGSAVHHAGNLQVNVTNFGFFGSLPLAAYPMSDSPSGQWPAGSGIEYLYAAGIWVGAEMDGVPSVSTGYPETEFYPTNDPVDRIYESYEGALGGNRYPGAADDDLDGRVDEDWLNGRDDDGDGRIDEDFAAIGKLMYSCWFTDDQPVAQQVWPEHVPLYLKVRQESYQWSEEGLNNFVAVRYLITNRSKKALTNAYVGIYADLDAGPRDSGNYFKDDMIGTWEGIWCAPIAGIEMPVRFSVVYVYDKDGDGGRTPGYFGVAFLGSQYSIPGEVEPTTADLRSVNIFAGLLPYERGGEPINDYQRYASMSKSWMAPATEAPNDYKALLSVGPFYYIVPEFSITLDVAFVAGEGLEGMLNSAALAALVYRGIWHDLDRNALTGINGREGRFVGPTQPDQGIDPDYCDDLVESIEVAKHETLFCNLDCREERELWDFADCYKGSMMFSQFQTGVNGKEAQIHWITSTAPAAPSLRAIAGDGTVTLLWDSASEAIPDAVTGLYDFEGYKIWRAHDWHRPLGTTAESGPSDDLWYILDGRDLVNGVPPDVDLKKPYSEGGFQYEPLGHMKDRDVMIRAFEENLRYDPLSRVPAPPGITGTERDTLEALARWNLGYDGGRRYYRYEDSSVKNGLPYFYAVVAYDHVYSGGKPSGVGLVDTPIANFVYVVPRSEAQTAEEFREEEVYVVPNPVTSANIAPWRLEPNNLDPTGEKLEFRNLPKCRCTVRIYTVAGDLVQTLSYDGRGGNGTLAWNLVSRNGQSVTSGVYLFAVEPDSVDFRRVIGKFVVIR
jgi:hypothetical protein